MMQLNPQQLEAVTSDSKRILCLAGAGSGKTRVLVERISRLVNDGADPESILAMTFTNAAAFEMEERYQKDHPNEKIPEFKTFHAFCYGLISADVDIRNRLGYSKIPEVALDEDIKRIQKECLMQLGIRIPQRKLKSGAALTDAEAQNVMLFKKAVKRMMHQKNIITFDEMCSSICDMFDAKYDLIQKYLKKYKFIFVDEYQDTDPIQHRFVMSFEDSSIFVVADALQSIYSFRGADSSIVKSLAVDSNWKTIKMFENYRSTVEICEYANKFSKYAPEEYRIPLHAERHGPEVTIIYGRPGLMYVREIDYDILEKVLYLYESNKGETAILARTNLEVESIKGFLRENKIPFTSKDSGQDAYHILKSASDEQFAINWLASKLTGAQYMQYVRLSSLYEHEHNSPYGLLPFLNEFGFVEQVSTLIEDIIAIQTICRDTPDIRARLEKISNKLDVKFEDKEYPSDTDEFLLDLATSMTRDSEADIYVGTVHSVKGLEYDNVYVLGVNSFSFPLEDEENKNLFYVAVTRAKNKLFVFYQGDKKHASKASTSTF